MLDAGHFSAVRRSFESRAMPETEKPPAIAGGYLLLSFVQFKTACNLFGNSNKEIKVFECLQIRYEHKIK